MYNTQPANSVWPRSIHCYLTFCAFECGNVVLHPSMSIDNLQEVVELAVENQEQLQHLKQLKKCIVIPCIEATLLPIERVNRKDCCVDHNWYDGRRVRAVGEWNDKANFGSAADGTMFQLDLTVENIQFNVKDYDNNYKRMNKCF